MRVAFDLDDTLIRCRARFPTEPPSSWGWSVLTREVLRAGTGALLTSLRAEGSELWVYTTSYRSPFAVRALFRAYGVSLAGVVNQDRHDRDAAVKVVGRCIKYPPAFGIDLLVDDSIAVANEGARLGYRVLLLREDDAGWTERVVAAVRRV